MFTLIMDNKTYQSDNYEAFCEDIDLWNRIQNESKFKGTGGDWKHIALGLHTDYIQQIDHSGLINVWHGIYQPYTIPAIGYLVTE